MVQREHLESVNERGVPLCAIYRRAPIALRDTREMTDAELEELFLETDWPFPPSPSWVEDEE